MWFAAAEPEFFGPGPAQHRQEEARELRQKGYVPAYGAFIGELLARILLAQDLLAGDPPCSLGGENHWYSHRNRRTIIGEGAHPLQGLIRRASHRGPSQDKGEGED